MRKNKLITDTMINFYFGLAIVICCIGMVYALVVFVLNCNYLRLSINRMIDNYKIFSDVQVNEDFQNEIDSISDNIQVSKFSETNYIENLIGYAIKLQELEANSVSTNILVFLYTFLSGSLIGVATYFTKKSYDSIKQIEANKELLASLDNRTLFANLYIYAQRTHSTMQVFSVSLDAIRDDDALSDFIDKYVPTLNDFINEMRFLFNEKKENIKILGSEEKKHLINEIYGIEKIIDNLHVPQSGHPLITNISNDLTKEHWKEQLDSIRNILRI